MYCNRNGLGIYQTVSIQDSHGDPQEMLREVKTNINCDMQPYSTEKLQKDYGLNIEVTKRVFMGIDNNIVDLVENQKKTLTLKDGNVSYEIRKIIPWDNYMEVMIYGI